MGFRVRVRVRVRVRIRVGVRVRWSSARPGRCGWTSPGDIGEI